MASMCMAVFVLLSVLVLNLVDVKVQASDPELTTDFFIPETLNLSLINGSYFTFTGFRDPAPTTTSIGPLFEFTPAFSGQFPALTGLGVSFVFLHFFPGGMTPPHLHPRASELFYVLQGCLTVGLIDSSNKYYSQSLQAGDVFVFPKGLVHFQINDDPNHVEATAIGAYSSSNPGGVLLPKNLFGSTPSIDPQILEQAFSVKASTIAMLEAPFSGKPIP